MGFILLIGSVCVVLWPWTFTFENDPRVITDSFIELGHDTDSTLRWLAKFNAENWFANRDALNKMLRVYVVGIAGLAATVLCLMFAFVL